MYGKLHRGTTGSYTRTPVYESIGDIGTFKGGKMTAKNGNQSMSKDTQEAGCFVVIPEDQFSASSNKSTLVDSQLSVNDYNRLILSKAATALSVVSETTSTSPSNSSKAHEEASTSYFVLSSDEQAGENFDQYTPLSTQSNKNQDPLHIPKETSSSNEDKEASCIGPSESIGGQGESSASYFVLLRDEQVDGSVDTPTRLSDPSDKNQDPPDIPKATSTLEVDNRASDTGTKDSLDGQGESSASYFILLPDEQVNGSLDTPRRLSAPSD